MAAIPGLAKKSVEPKSTPVLVLESAPRNKIRVIHRTDKDLGFRTTWIDAGALTVTEDIKYVFKIRKKTPIEALVQLVQGYPTITLAPRCFNLVYYFLL